MSISMECTIPDNSVLNPLLTDTSDNFSDYMALLNIPADRNLIILPSSKHYYYETKDLKKVKILVNPKQLNEIKNIRDFLHNVSSVLPLKSYFIGIFFDNKDKNIFLSDPYKPPRVSAGPFDLVENGISSRVPFLNFLYRLIDFKFGRYMTNTTVNLHLGAASMKVLDMTDIQGFTYFCAQKVLQSS